jgi:hypothetical protein
MGRIVCKQSVSSAVARPDGPMRFAMGMIGGILSLLLVVLGLLLFAHNAHRVFAGLGMMISGVGVGWSSAVGVLLLVCMGALLGGVFESGVCGRIATGPAIGVGLVYGVFVWLFTEFLLLPVFADGLDIPIGSGEVGLASVFFGVLMGVWVIVAAHIWPNIGMRCE